MKRRDFVKITTAGLVGVAVGSRLRLPPAFAQISGPTISLGMAVANVEMVDTNPVPHWLYTVQGVPTFPGPAIFAFANEAFTINLTNSIPGLPRRFAIVGTAIESGLINPGATGSVTISAGSLAPGTYLYKDPTNDPISRVMGLHGALVILPSPTATNPYDPSTPNVTALFNALGVPAGPSYDPLAIFPGQKWFATTDAAVPAYNPTSEPPSSDSDFEHHEAFAVNPAGPMSEIFERFLYRTRIWVHSTIDPFMNTAVIAGTVTTPGEFRANYNPQYFTLNGRSGGYAAHSPDVTIVSTVGEPHLIRNLNAGMATHSPHLHANHFYVTAVNNVVGGGGVYFGNAPGSDIIVFLDAVTIGPEDRMDWLVPFIRPQDIPRVLTDGSIHIPGEPVPLDETLVPLAQLIPEELNLVLIVSQNPLTYPMHSHMELDQTAAGGNYPQGAVTQFEIIGEFGSFFFPRTA